jgi:hypothetical protein
LQGAELSPQIQTLSLNKGLRPYQLLEKKQASMLAVMRQASTPVAPAE